MYYSPVDAHVGVAYNSRVTMVTWCDNLVGVSVYISLIDFGNKIYLMITKLWYSIRMTIIDTRLKIWYNQCIIRQYIHSKTAENHILFSKQANDGSPNI